MLFIVFSFGITVYKIQNIVFPKNIRKRKKVNNETSQN